MHSDHKSQVRIAELGQHPEHVDTVAVWILEEWGSSSRDRIKASLLENEGCPPALVATSPDDPCGVLGYKLYALAGRDSEELWVNALYVAPPWRGRGIGRRLVDAAMKASQRFGRNALYVYTDIPAFYEALGWRRFSYNSDTGMHVLEYGPRIQQATT